MHSARLLWPTVLGFSVLSLAGIASQSAGNRQTLGVLTAEQREILSHMSLVQLDDGMGGQVQTLRISGVNVQIVNGLGATNGYPLAPSSFDGNLTQVNGLGNLILGYNETDAGSVRTGSHNLIVGRNNDYTSFASLVAGTDNDLLAPASSIAGGFHNVTSAVHSAILGGEDNATAGERSAIGGGISNRANALRSWISGGQGNNANASAASIAGGAGVTITEALLTGVGPLYLKP